MHHFKTAIRAIISIGLMAYLIYVAEPHKISGVLLKVIRNNGLLFLGLAIISMLAAIFMMSIRWKFLVNRYQIRRSIFQLYGYYLIGLFFNNFLPTSIGGDIYRVIKISDNQNHKTKGIATIITERMLGIAATLFLAIISLYFVSKYFHDERLLYISVSLFLGISFFFFIMTRNRPFKWLLLIFSRITIFNIGERINKLFEAIHELRTKRRTFGYVFIFSLLSQVLIVTMNYFLCRALSIQLDLSYLFLVVTITFVLTMLPSINGVGIRDLGYVTLLAEVGVTNAEAISLSFLNLLILMIISIWGAVLFIIQRKKQIIGEQHANQNAV